jgi:hypothetical protein
VQIFFYKKMNFFVFACLYHKVGNDAVEGAALVGQAAELSCDCALMLALLGSGFTCTDVGYS